MSHPTGGREGLALFRRTVVIVMIAFLSVAALAGIFVLLGGGVDETGGKVLLTTFAAGLFALGLLCCGSILDKPAAPVGYIGMAIVILSLVTTVWTIWADINFDGLRPFFTGVVLSIAFSAAALLLLLADRTAPAVRGALWITIGLIAVLTVTILLPVWELLRVEGDGYGRLVGVIAILTGLGIVITPVLGFATRSSDSNGQVRHAPQLPAPEPQAAISPALAAELSAVAAQRGISVEQLVAPVLYGAPLPPAGPAPQPPLGSAVPDAPLPQALSPRQYDPPKPPTD